jgi:plasmid stability protein
MASSLLIRDLGEETKKQLRIRAARKGHSMAREAREILKQAVVAEHREDPNEMHLVDRIRQTMKRSGGVVLPKIPRHPMRDPVKF